MKQIISAFLFACVLLPSLASAHFHVLAGDRQELRKKSSVANKQENRRASKKAAAQPPRSRRAGKSSNAETALTTPTPPVAPSPAVLSNSLGEPEKGTQSIPEDVKSGNVDVVVNANANTFVRLGLSPRGVTVIEFPADDPVYKIFPADEGFVTVDCSRRDSDNRCLDEPTDAMVLRPGKNFHALGASAENSTIITVQRVSGIVVTFVLVPVREIKQNANYVVVRYNVEEQIRMRQKLGLPVNLAGDRNPNPEKLKNARPANNQKKPVAQSGNAQPNSDNARVVQASFPSSANSGQTDADENTGLDAPAAALGEGVNELDKLTQDELKRVGASKLPLQFSKPIHGLSLATATAFVRLKDHVVDVIAVRNTLNVPLRLVPDVPSLNIENRPEKGKTTTVSNPIAILFVATTADDDNILQPGEIYYFAFAYEFPVLGAKQVLRASFAQTNAADEPAIIELTGYAR